ncbi:MAG: hypothetical protein H0U92_08770, partial [Actinobacteria bacterium]|nr:hypothetical protein [Actinomycetota bacterium]
MPARFFVDETDLWLAKRLAAVHADVAYPGSSSLPSVPRGTPDDDWLPIVGRLGLVVFTRDKRIRYRPVERQSWVTHGVRGFALTSTKS